MLADILRFAGYAKLSIQLYAGSALEKSAILYIMRLSEAI
jgi:hypothetical protein